MGQEALLINSVAQYIPNFAIDVVAVFDQDYTQLFQNARPIKAIVKEDSKVMEHPLETGATIIDHRIIQPIEIEMSLILNRDDYQDAYQTIKQLFLNATLLIVQTRSATYTNQLIQSMPHDEDPEFYNTLLLTLKLKEVQFVTSKTEPVPKNKNNISTVNRGNIEPTSATSSQEASGSFIFDQTFGRKQ